MPIYEYLCRTCNRVYSFMAATTADERMPSCPRCGNPDMEKQISLFAFVRGGTNPLAAIPASADESLSSESAGKPEHDDGLYFTWQTGRLGEP